jgi:Glycosyltransferase family 87
VVAAALIVVLTLTALLLVAGLRLDGVVATLVAAYVIAVGELVALTTVLSPFRAVTREGLAVAELVLGLTAVTAWWLLGRPSPPLGHAAATLRQFGRDPATLALLIVCSAAVGYELLLVLSVPPNNWDSLTYHLARAAAWAQHGGVYWIDNAPTDRINEFQPLAEQEILFLFAAAGSGALFALPQFVAQAAIVLAVYTSARRLGYGVEAAAGSSLLFLTFTIVALEATTAQNDLVAASLPAAAAALLLGTRRSETALAGLAAGLMLGVKLNTIFVLPVLVTLAALRGRRPLLQFAGATVVTFVALGMWGFVRNVAMTGDVLGRGGGRLEHTAETSLVGTLATAFRVAYRSFDLSGFDDWMIWAMAIAGLGVALGIAAAEWGRGSRRATALTAAAAAIPLLAPALVLGLAAVSHAVAKGVRLPVNEEANTSAHFSWHVNRDVNEDLSGFGPLGLLLLAASFATIVAARRTVDRRRLALALAVPLSIIGIALTAKYNPWLSRFLLAPIALTAPLLATFFRRQGAALAIVIVAACTVGLTHARNIHKPVEDARRMPWTMSQADAVDLPWLSGLAEAQRILDQRVPSSECLGALLDRDDPTYLLYGTDLQRQLTFLTVPGEWQRAVREGLRYIVINAGDYQDARARMRARGWKLERLGYWVLATSPVPGGPCPPPQPPGSLTLRGDRRHW